MSLINEALKKAQKSRNKQSGANPNFAGGFTGASTVARDFTLFKWIFSIILMSTLLVLLIFMLYAFITKPTSISEAPPTSDEFTVTLAKTTTPNHAEPTTRPSLQRQTSPSPTTPNEPETPQIVFNLEPPDPQQVAPLPFENQVTAPPYPLPDSIPDPVAQVTAPPPESTEALSTSPQAPPELTTAAAHPTPATTPVQPLTEDADTSPSSANTSSVTIHTFLEDHRIMGIRMAGENSRVLFNNRVYSVGSTVSHELGLSIESIQPNEIVFIDAAGSRYRKTFP